jgi:hypothetical protein
VFYVLLSHITTPSILKALPWKFNNALLGVVALHFAVNNDVMAIF